MPWFFFLIFWQGEVTFKSFLTVALQNSMFASIHELMFIHANAKVMQPPVQDKENTLHPTTYQ